MSPAQHYHIKDIHTCGGFNKLNSHLFGVTSLFISWNEHPQLYQLSPQMTGLNYFIMPQFSPWWRLRNLKVDIVDVHFRIWINNYNKNLLVWPSCSMKTRTRVKATILYTTGQIFRPWFQCFSVIIHLKNFKQIFK